MRCEKVQELAQRIAKCTQVALDRLKVDAGDFVTQGLRSLHDELLIPFHIDLEQGKRGDRQIEPVESVTGNYGPLVIRRNRTSIVPSTTVRKTHGTLGVSQCRIECTNILCSIECDVSEQIFVYSRMWFERIHPPLLSDKAGRSQTEQTYVCAHINDSVTGTQVTAEELTILMTSVLTSELLDP